MKKCENLEQFFEKTSKMGGKAGKNSLKELFEQIMVQLTQSHKFIQ